MRPSGRGGKDLPLIGAVGGGACSGGGGGIHVVAVVPAVTAAVRRRRHGAVGDRRRHRAGRIRRFEVVGQDQLPQLRSSGEALRGDVHVRGVGAQQPRRQQGEGYAPSAAVDLTGKRTLTVNLKSDESGDATENRMRVTLTR